MLLRVSLYPVLRFLVCLTFQLTFEKCYAAFVCYFILSSDNIYIIWLFQILQVLTENEYGLNF